MLMMKNELKPHSTHIFGHNLCAYWYLTRGIKWRPFFWYSNSTRGYCTTFSGHFLCQVVPASLIFGRFFLVSWESWEYGDTTLRNHWTQAEKNQISTQLLTLGSEKNHHSCNHTLLTHKITFQHSQFISLWLTDKVNVKCQFTRAGIPIKHALDKKILC